MKISVIIPVFREADIINDTLSSLHGAGEGVEIIVVDGDGGSTLEWVSGSGVICLITARGRGLQMNAGAARASGDILLFLHADTRLPHGAFEKIRATMADDDCVAGAFNYAVETRNLFLRHIYYTSYLRSRISRITYGDQAIFIRADYFRALGGYADIPIMEDVDLMKRIKKNGKKIRILKEGVKTSTRRYEKEGIIYSWLRNHWLRFLYHCGVHPCRLRRYYPDTR